MKIILTDNNPRMIEAWRMFFSEEKNVEIRLGDLTDLVCDAIVSPANSFGFMDGGVDAAISARLGWHIEKEVQAKIKALPMGELLIGQAMTIETNFSKTPYLIVAPTMRVPTNKNISNSVNAYLAMKAVLIEVLQNTDIQTVAMTGFCTGIGQMQPELSARQMFWAYKEIVLNQKMDFKNFVETQKRHVEINPISFL